MIRRVLEGDKDSFLDLIQPYQRTVYATMVSMLGSKEDAEDVTQDVLLKALARLHQFRQESAFGTWLIQIAINEARMRRRKLRQRSEIRGALANALTLLEEHYRLAFILRDVNELSITETANVLGITRGAVKTRLRRARLMLRDILSPELQQGGQVALAFKEARKTWQ